MIGKEKKIVVYTCLKCGKNYKDRMGSAEIYKCVKCGGTKFMRTQETEVITK